jgi:CheY-like chemotaxis protein
VRLRVEREEQRATVSVRDTGIGIPAEILPHVFDTFTQGDQSLDRRHGGLGLGLALVKGIVELHGGEVQATSSGLGCGAEFTIWLPLDPAAKPVEQNTKCSGPSAKPLRILIVEDNRDAAKTLGLLMRRYGHEVTLAHSGTSAVEAAKRWGPDVVLCDLGLPEMDGFEVASILRQDPAMAAARLIAISGYGDDDDRQRSQAAGFDLHLIKPVDPAELQRLLADREMPNSQAPMTKECRMPND